MKTRYIALVSIISTLALSALAQTNTPAAPQPINVPTNVTQAASGIAPVAALLEWLPAWDKTATNSFNAGELTIESAPLWKSMTASGSTPYISLAADYYFAKWIGAGAEVISLGNGQGNNTIDSMLAEIRLRKDWGNIAGYIRISGGYDDGNKRGMFAAGPGVAYRAKNGLESFVDVQGETEGKGRNGALTRIGVGLWF